MKKYTHEKAHEEIDYIFKTLLPQRGMAERPEQIRLCHSILDAMLDGSIALCDAGTGIGKTFAYLTAGILHGKCRAAEGKPQRPIFGYEGICFVFSNGTSQNSSARRWRSKPLSGLRWRRGLSPTVWS